MARWQVSLVRSDVVEVGFEKAHGPRGSVSMTGRELHLHHVAVQRTPGLPAGCAVDEDMAQLRLGFRAG
jgi:hypothetical protein